MHSLASLATGARRRLHPHLPAVLQTAAAAVGAWYLAVLLLPVQQPAFAAIAAVICLGVAHGQRRRRTLELIGGVLMGIAIATVLVYLIGTGPPQIAVLVILAMSAALLLRGGELLVNEAAVSAILLVSFQSEAAGFSADRMLEGLIGGGVALAVASALLPPNPIVMVGQVAQTVFGKLGHALEETADALSEGDARRAEAALATARSIDADIGELRETLLVAGETARFSPSRRAQRGQLRRYEQTTPQLDFAVRNTRVLIRSAVGLTRHEAPAPHGLAAAVGELGGAVWALAAQFEEPDRRTDVERRAVGAARRAEAIHERERALGVSQVAGQVRSLAVDLVRAGEALAEADATPQWEAPTEELLAVA